MNQKYAIVTITDAQFMPGTLTLFYSILKHNSWFKGDLVVISDELEEVHLARLAYFPNFKSKQVGSGLLERTSQFTQKIPSYQSRIPRFYSLEAFQMQEYDKVLFLDSDMLCLGNLQALFNIDMNEKSLAVTPDFPYFLGKKRQKNTFLPTSLAEQQSEEIYIDGFSSGMMLIDMTTMSLNTYTDLLALLTPELYKQVKTGHTDQYLLNQYFLEKVNFVSVEYNYMLHAQDAIRQQTQFIFANAKLLHYTKDMKPWYKTNISIEMPWDLLWGKYHIEAKNRLNHE